MRKALEIGIFSDDEDEANYRKFAFLMLILMFSASSVLESAYAAESEPARSISGLRSSAGGISEAHLMEIPRACGINGIATSAKPPPASTNPPPLLPVGTRMWECIPGVIRDNGADMFRVEVNANGAVSNIVMQLESGISSASGRFSLNMRDDGLQGDRVEHDFIYTSELLRFKVNFDWLLQDHYQGETNSPAGVNVLDVGEVTVTETNGTQNTFLIEPQVGILSSNLPLAEVVMLSTNVAISGHVVNVRGANLSTQKFLRKLISAPTDIDRLIYEAMPDAFDILLHLSTYHIEIVPYSTTANLISGIEHQVQVNFTGTGQGLFNTSSTYGSAGRLLSQIALDSYDRGLLSENCAHEILHTWSSNIGHFSISDGAHYNSRSSVASLLGGHMWATNGDGTWTLICEEGRNGATHIAPLDKYMMGLLSVDQVPLLRIYPDSMPYPLDMCNGIITDVQSTLSAGEIASYYGPRSPGPATARRSFSLGFVVESNSRLLNPVEMTFYEIFADHFTKKAPMERPDPYVGFNWVSIARYFGADTTWSSDVLDLIRPKIIKTERVMDGSTQISGTGYPGWNYRLLKSTNLEDWSTVTNKAAETNGTFFLIDSQRANGSCFYRVATP